MNETMLYELLNQSVKLEEDFKLKYCICDIECLKDYFSFQVKNESSNKIYVYECYNDIDIHKLYKMLSKSRRPQYYYSIDYDKTILNALCKFVEKGISNIIPKLRKVSDYLIVRKLNYFRLNTNFWVDHYFKYKKQNSELKHYELFRKSHLEFINDPTSYDFIDEFPELLGQSEIIKETIMNSIPKILYYFSIRKDNSIIPTISLKNLQLVKEGYNIKFDFGKYDNIADIKKNGLFDKFIQYSKNDISSLEKVFLDEIKSDILKRWYAISAVRTINPNFQYNDKMCYSENNTLLITEILKLPENEINKNIKIDYTEHIKTNYNKFNNFVKFVNDRQDIKKDKDIKNEYIQIYEKEYREDDKQIINELGEIETKINSFDEILIENEQNKIIAKIGFGGLHGALTNVFVEGLWHYDYESQYPSIILQYKEYFKNIMNVELYEAIYKMRNDSKPLLNSLEQMFENNECKLELYEKVKKYLERIVSGLKLILNMTYGLINSNFTLPISCKILGRFICLKGQELILNLSDRLKENNVLYNLNTDGIICKGNEIIDISPDNYFKVGIKKMEKLIQFDVNNYLSISNGKIKAKGLFNISIKQWINKNEKLAANLYNAINLITGKDIELKPIYFDRRYFKTEILDKSWYFTTKEKGQQIIKYLKKPEIISLENEAIYFTLSKEDADPEIYKILAEKTKNKILNFKYYEKSKNLKYIEKKLDIDSEENIKEKRNAKRQLAKKYGTKQIGMISKNNTLIYFNGQLCDELIHYTMTDVLKSKECHGFIIENNKYNLDNHFLFLEIKNKKYIFLNENNINIKEIEKYENIKIMNNIIIYTLDQGIINYEISNLKSINYLLMLSTNS